MFPPHIMFSPAIVLLHLFTLQLNQCSTDLCNWTGSGFAAAVDPRIVLQVRLRCSAGSVRWLSPGQALRVMLEPNLSPSSRLSAPTAICIKAAPSLRGASVFVERSGELELLVADGDRPRRQVICFRAEGARRPALYLQASPQGGDGGWSSRRPVGFRYEVMLGNRSSAANLDPNGPQASCRPCNDTELLLAVCNSDFVVRGHIRAVVHSSETQTSAVDVSAARVYWQRGAAFQRRMDPGAGKETASWHGRIHALLRCHVKPGDGEFLFTGSEHFGEAWLGCAPRYKDFLSVYQRARAARQNSCHFPSD